MPRSIERWLDGLRGSRGAQSTWRRCGGDYAKCGKTPEGDQIVGNCYRKVAMLPWATDKRFVLIITKLRPHKNARVIIVETSRINTGSPNKQPLPGVLGLLYGVTA